MIRDTRSLSRQWLKLYKDAGNLDASLGWECGSRFSSLGLDQLFQAKRGTHIIGGTQKGSSSTGDIGERQAQGMDCITQHTLTPSSLRWERTGAAVGGTQGPRSPLGFPSSDALSIVSTRHMLAMDCLLSLISTTCTDPSPAQCCDSHSRDIFILPNTAV